LKKYRYGCGRLKSSDLKTAAPDGTGSKKPGFKTGPDIFEHPHRLHGVSFMVCDYSQIGKKKNPLYKKIPQKKLTRFRISPIL
jgi:hypothetical protein